MNKKTFKVFNEEVAEEKFNDQTLRRIATEIVDGGFLNNYMEMVKSNSWFFRGSSYLANKIDDDSVFVKPVSDIDRTSTFGYHHIMHDIWHMEKMPSRKRAIFATFDKAHANDFGDIVILIPKDKTELVGLTTDLNLSNVKYVEEFFGLPNRGFGDLSESFVDIAEEISHLTDDWKTPAQKIVHDQWHDLYAALVQFTATKHKNADGPIRNIFKLLDTCIKSLAEEKEARHWHDQLKPPTKRFLKLMHNDYVSKNKSTFDAIRQLNDSIKNDIVKSTSPSQLKVALRKDDETQSEIWWEGDSLVIPERFEKRMHNTKLIKYIEKYKSSGFDPRPTTVKRAKTVKPDRILINN